jgi:hypothetical protein
MKAVFVFCEGNHDVTFVVRSLGQVVKATWVGDPIGKLPSPLGSKADLANPAKPPVVGIIAKRYSNRTLDELGLQAAAHAPPPSFEAIVKQGDTIYVLVRCHGDGAAQSATEILTDVSTLLNPAFGTDIKEVAAAFIFDADESLSQREAAFSTKYATILGGVAAPTHGTWAKGSHRVGLYVFHDQTAQKGTLDELIAPFVEAEWKDRWQGADSYLNSHAQTTDPVKTKRSEWLKAQINVTGQFLFPGDPMSIVISKPKGGRPGLSDHHFAGSESKSLVAFLQAVPW